MDDSIWEYMPYGSMRSEDDIRRWIGTLLDHMAEGTDLPFVVIHLRIGPCGRHDTVHGNSACTPGLEIGGTWYGAEFRRTQVNTECKYLLLRQAFEEFSCIRVQLKTDLRNERSQRAIERIGAVKEGMLRNHMILPNGHIRHSIYYSIIDSEWPAVKLRLEQMLG